MIPRHLPRPVRWFSLILLALVLMALLGQLAVYLHYTGALLRFPFDYDQGEGFELYDTMLHAQGQWPYQDSQVFPFYTSIYPPLYHLLVAPLVWAFGPYLWTGRLVGFLASLVAGGTIGWGVYRASGNRIVAIFSGLAFLASNFTFHIGPLFRQHMTMVMFETLAIVALAQLDNASFNSHGAPRIADGLNGLQRDGSIHQHHIHPRSPLTLSASLRFNGALWLGLLFLLAAGYTKQLALATVLAGLAYLFLRGPRRAVLAGLGLAVAAGGLFLAINLATSGWWYVSIIRANINTYDLNQALSLYRQWTELHLVLVGLALARLVHETYFGRLSAYAVWFVFAAANGALSGKFGAGESYFVTATAAACALSGIGVAAVLRRAHTLPVRRAAAVALVAPLLYLAQARLTLHMYTQGAYAPFARLLGVTSESDYFDSQGYTQLGPRPTRADHDAGWEIVELARREEGPVFSEEAAFPIRAGKPVVTNPFPQLVMYQAGLFDPAEEIRQINAKSFGLVIFRAQFYPPPVLQAIGANYEPWTEIRMNGFTYRILKPRP